VSKINHDLRNLLASSQLLSDQLASVPDPGAALCAETDALAGARDRVLPVDAVLWPRPGGRTRPAHDPARADRRGGTAKSAGLATDASIMWISAGRARAGHRRRSRSAVSRPAQPGAQRGAGAGKPPPQRRRQHANSHHRAPRRLGRDIGGSDTGPGVPAKAREHLFEAFQTTGRPGGSGLGLAIAAELVRAHGGDIHLVEGTIGATFRVAIPDRPVELLSVRNERARA